MLRRIEVHGFKSLIDFELVLKPGLNVLVGPNGAGKTNVLKFFEFLSDLSEHPLFEAVSQSGGAGEIFYRRTDGTLHPEITFEINGHGNFQRFVRRKNEPEFPIAYDYSAKINLTENSVFFSKQEVKLAIGRSPPDTSKPDLWVTWEYDIDNKKPWATVNKVDVKRLSNFGPYSPEDRKSLQNALSKDTTLLEHSMVEYLSFAVPILRIISSDINSGRSYNINPAKVREAEDIAKKPGIAPDGGGLASTLFSLGRHGSEGAVPTPSYPFFRYRPFLSAPPEAYEQIQEFSRLVSDNIDRLEARPDTIENKNRVYVTFSNDGIENELPISFVSDGTAKWFSLIAAIVTSRSAFCIEEPENFLHPKLQEQIVGIARALSENSEFERFALMTTHSQTLLNALYPEEVIVASREGGGTKCRRPSNASKLDELINRTGFGLGYFYLTDAIE